MRYGKKGYIVGAPRGHFIAQPSPYAQKMAAAASARALVKWEKGRSIQESGRGFLLSNRRRILDQLADALVDHLRLGVVHGDILPGNILVYRGSRRRPVKIKLIDYEMAMPMMGGNIESTGHVDYGDVLRDVIPALARGKKGMKGSPLLALAAGKMDAEKLKELFPGMEKAKMSNEEMRKYFYSATKDRKDIAELKEYFEMRFLEKVRKKL